MSESELLNEKQALLQTLKKEDDFQPKHWTYACELLDKSVEIGRNIEELETLGCKVHYFSVDVSDYSALSSVLKSIRKLGGFDGVIHGAGYELAKPFEKKTKEIIERTLAKADGLINLFNLTKDDSVRYFAAFSSVVGRFGGHGQTDYAVANEVVARFIGTARKRNLVLNIRPLVGRLGAKSAWPPDRPLKLSWKKQTAKLHEPRGRC